MKLLTFYLYLTAFVAVPIFNLLRQKSNTLLWICIFDLLLALLLLFEWNSTTKYNFLSKVFTFHFYFTAFILIPPVYLLPQKINRILIWNAGMFAQIRKLLGITYEVRNEENALGIEAAVMVLNHQHTIDPITHCYLLSKFSWSFSLMMKKLPYDFWPLYQVTTKVLKFSLINNDGTVNDEMKKDMKNMIHTAVKEKRKIIIYPEGTRNISGKLLPFKKGAFKIAIENQLPILPVVSSPLYFIDDKKKIFNKGKVIIEILKPVSTKGLTLQDVVDLTQNVQSQMSEKFSELQKEIHKMRIDNQI